MINNPDYFKNTYRTPTNRSQSWDYAGSGTYFITICTKDKVKWFGEIQDDQMKLSEIGRIAQACWMEIPQHFPFVYVDQFVVMPNHIHGILSVDKYTETSVETQDFASLPPGNVFGPQSRNLASIVRGFKVGVTTHARHIHQTFSWQPRFHDKIIRNEKQLSGIRKYIIANPYNWQNDEEYILS